MMKMILTKMKLSSFDANFREFKFILTFLTFNLSNLFYNWIALYFYYKDNYL